MNLDLDNIIFTLPQLLEIKKFLNAALQNIIAEEGKNSLSGNDPISDYGQRLTGNIGSAIWRIQEITNAHIDAEMAKKKDEVG